MKALYFIVLMLSMCIGTIGSVKAQVSVKECNGKSYVYNTRKIYRERSMLLNSSEKVNVVEFTAVPKQNVNDIYKDVLSSERLKELSSKVLLTTFCTDYNGDVKYVEFLFKETPYLNVDEVEKLEAKLLNCKFEIKTSKDIEGDNDYKFSIICPFAKLIK